MPHLRPCRQPGAGGKTARVYHLVDAYYDDIEDDLFTYFGVDALDYFRGVKPWDQFLRLVDRLAAKEGSACWALKLSDPDMLEGLWEKYRKDRRMFDDVEDARPELYGFDRTQAALLNIANLLIAQRIDKNPNVQRSLKMLPTPVFPKEALEIKWSQLAKRKRDSGIEAAQAAWDDIVRETGVRPNG